MKVHTWVLAAAVMASPAVADAATFWVANLNGARVVPATGSGGSGLARVMLNDAETEITVSMYWGSLQSGTTGAHIHAAGPGLNGGAQVFIPPPAGVTSGSVVGSTFPISPSQVNQLKSGLWYIDIHTTNFPAGEIRGQFELTPILTASMTGQQTIPAGVQLGSGRAWISLNEYNNIALITASWNNLPDVPTSAHLHIGRSGTTGGPGFCDLVPTAINNGIVFDRLCVVTPAQVAALKSGQVYVDVHNAVHPAGAVRGQIKRGFNPCDFDGDGKSDPTIVRNNGVNLFWFILRSTGGVMVHQWGTSGDFFGSRLMCPDMDGDGKADPTIWRAGPAAQYWTLLSSTGGALVQQWGTTSDDPRVIGDYDGDGRDDFAIHRPGAQSQYWVLRSSDSTILLRSWGITGDFPQSVPDVDGDGRTDLVVQRGGQFWVQTNGLTSIQTQVLSFGLGSDFHQGQDYDGDGRTDIAISRISGGQREWWIRSSMTGLPMSPYGSGTIFGSVASPASQRAAADYNGDGRAEIAVWKADVAGGPGYWWTLDVKTGAVTTTQWGVDGDLAVQNSYWH